MQRGLLTIVLLASLALVLQVKASRYLPNLLRGSKKDSGGESPPPRG